MDGVLLASSSNRSSDYAVTLHLHLQDADTDEDMDDEEDPPRPRRHMAPTHYSDPEEATVRAALGLRARPRKVTFIVVHFFFYSLQISLSTHQSELVVH